MNKRGDLRNGLPPDDQSGAGDYQPRPNGLDRASELKLIDAALLNDMQAFSELFEHYRPALYGLCCRRLNDPSLAEDVVQEAFLKTFSNLSSFNRNKLVWPWLATIANRMCVDLQRHRALTQYYADPRVAVDEDAETNGHAESALDEVIASEDRAELWESLKVLPKRQRRALLLYVQDGMSYADIAAAEGISIGAVELLIVRARRKMRKQAGRPLPAIVFPVTWLRWKVQQIEERAQRPLLSVYSEGFSTACAQAACLGALLTMVVSTSLPSSPVNSSDAVASNEAVLSVTQSRSQQTVLPQTALPNIGDRAKAPVEPQQRVANPASSLVEDVINPNQNATPETTSFKSITASSNYESDSTILAGGTFKGNRVLFVSQDGGGTWKPQPSRLLDGSNMVLPPNFPKDGRIFASGGLGLQQSDDGGEIFRVVSPALSLDLAISPSFGRGGSIAGGDSRILMGGNSVLEYDAGTGVTQPALLSVPPTARGYSSIAFSPNYPSDSTVFVSEKSGASYRCKGPVCDEMQLSTRGPLRLRFSPRFDQDGLAYAFTPWKSLVSSDGAQTFGDVQFPLEVQFPLTSEGYIRDLAVAWNTPSDPAIYVSVYESSTLSRYPPGIYRSLDAGRSWSRTPIDLPGFGGANKLIITPTGRFLAIGILRGIVCSVDQGQTWAPRCPPEQ